MRKKLLAALVFQIVLALAVLLSPLGLTQIVEKFGTEAEFKATTAYLFNYSYDEDEPSYQLDMRVAPVDASRLKRSVSATDADGNYISYDFSSRDGWVTYRFKGKESQLAFAAEYDGVFSAPDALETFIKTNDVTVEIRCFYRYAVVEGVYVNGVELENFALEKGYLYSNE